MLRRLVAASTLLLAACDGGAAGGVEISQDEAAVLGAMCDYLTRCPSDAFAFQPQGREECIRTLYFALTCHLDYSPDAYGIDQFNVEFVDMPADGAALAACRTWLEASSCEGWRYVNEGPCGALGSSFGADDDGGDSGPPATPGEGESCERTYTCQGDLRCIDYNGYPGYPDESQTNLCRVCVALKEQGEDCSIVNCRWDETVELVCHPTTHLCVPAPTAGACVAQSCATGFYCDNATTSCVPRGVVGQECAVSGVWCAQGLHCSVALGTCQTPEADGVLCGASDGCASEFCNQELGPEGTYQGLCDPGGWEGDPCETSLGCRNHYCELSLRICIDKRADGEPCYRDFQCTSSYCDEAAATCGRRGPGEACAVDGDCANGSCDDTALRCGLADGESCYNDDQCMGGGCSGGDCVTRVEIGESCFSDDQCLSRRCTDGQCRVACNSNEECAAGQWCHDFESSCVPLRADGEVCDREEGCSSGWCNDAGLCAHKPAIGEACAGGMDCYPWGQCKDGICAAQPGPGEACTGYDACMPPYACLEGVCERMGLDCRPAGLGERCTYFSVCDEGLYCDVLGGITCAARKANGASCLRDQECPSGSGCEGGTCASVPLLKAAGQPCDDSDECLSDYCSSGTCQPEGGVEPCIMP